MTVDDAQNCSQTVQVDEPTERNGISTSNSKENENLCSLVSYELF